MRIQSEYVVSQLINPTGASWLGVVVYCWQESATSTDIPCEVPGADTRFPRDEDVAQLIDFAHRLGMRVFVDLQVLVPESGSIRIGDSFTEAQWQRWFANYTELLVRYASIAEAHQVDLLSIGNELDGTEHRAGDWRAVAAEVRKTYSGPLTYKAHQWREVRVSWWDAVDFIGINAYYPVDPSDFRSVEDIKAAWDPYLRRMKALSDQWARPVVVTELGYSSFDGAGSQPAAWALCGPLDIQVQASLWDAALQTFISQPWIRGVFVWSYDSNPTQGGPYDRGPSPNGKPAEDVIRAFYGGAPRATPAATPALDSLPLTMDIIPIFEDYVDGQWRIDNPEEWINPQYSADTHSGHFAMAVNLPLWGSIGFDRETRIPQGTLLEFYIKVGQRHPDTLQVTVMDWKSSTWQELVGSLVIVGPRYLEGGSLTPGSWQLVRVPLDDIRATGRRFTSINIDDRSCRATLENGILRPVQPSPYDPIILDDMRLIIPANAPAP